MTPIDCPLLRSTISNNFSSHEWFEKAQKHMRKNKKTEAIWCLEKAHEASPDNLEYLIELHDLSEKKDHYRQKIDQFQCTTFDENLLKSDFYLDHDHEKAAVFALIASGLEPENFEAQFRYGVALFFQGKSSESIACLEQLLSKKESWPQDSRAENEQKVLTVMATVYFESKEYQKAEAFFMPVIQKGYSSPEIFTYYALTLEKLNHPIDAVISYLQKALELSPGSLDIHNHLVRIDKQKESLVKQMGALKV